jgi:integrase
VTAVRDGDWDALITLNREGVLLKGAVDDFLKRIEATSATNTYRQYRSVLTTLLAELGEDFEMHRLTTADAEAILHRPRIMEGDGDAREMVPWNARTQQNNRAKASTFWKYVIERQAEESALKKMVPLLTRNPWTKARIKTPRQKRPPVLDAVQMRALLTHPAVEGTPEACMLALGLLAGLRQGEILNLRRSDLFLDAPEPFLRVQSKPGIHEWDTKTARSQRDVPIPAALAAIINVHLSSGFAGAHYIITAGGNDRPINPTTSDNWTERAFEAAGIRYGRKKGDGLTIHHTRHSYATMLLSNGVSIAVVAELMGDRQETVLNTYSHALPNDRQRAVQLLETVL